MFCKNSDFRFFVEYSGKHLRWSLFFNPIQNRGAGGGGGRQKGPLYQFFPCNFYNGKKNYPQNISDF